MKTTEENNKMIAEFMGATIKLQDNKYYVYSWNRGNKLIQSMPITWKDTPEETISYIEEHLLKDYGDWGRFHTSWDWLMPVVEKIEELEFRVDIYSVNCDITDCRGTDIHKGFPKKFKTLQHKTKIESTYNAVVQFIEWYNENSKEN